MREDTETPEPSEQLRLVARARGESEYDLFVAAWRDWHGDGPMPGEIDADFGAYLQTEAVPAYVRHFLRRWLDAHPRTSRQQAEDRRAVQRARLLALVLITLAVVIAMLVGR